MLMQSRKVGKTTDEVADDLRKLRKLVRRLGAKVGVSQLGTDLEVDDSVEKSSIVSGKGMVESRNRRRLSTVEATVFRLENFLLEAEFSLCNASLAPTPPASRYEENVGEEDDSTPHESCTGP